MKDLVQKTDRLKAIAEDSRSRTAREGLTDAETVEIFSIAIDFVVELIANSRRIAVALERIADREQK